MDGTGEALLQSVTELGRHLFAAAACSLAVLEPDEEHLVFRAASGQGAVQMIGLRLPVSKGIAGWVVSSGQPIAIRDVCADPRFARDVAESTGYVPQSILAIPLETPRQILGVVEVLDRTVVADRDDSALLALLATPAALAVQLIRDADQQALPEPPDPATLLTALSRLGAEEQHTARVLLSEFMTYVGRRGGPAGLV